MSYNGLIKKSVDLAFKQLKDLAVDVTLTRVPVTDYSFENKEVVSSTPQTKVVKAIRQEKKIPGQPSPTIVTQLIFKAEDVDDPDLYDSVTVDGIVWKFIPPYENNGYTITVNLARQV